MKTELNGILLMAYGAAGSLDEVEPYLADIRAGRPPNPQLTEEVKDRYRQMGGKSPLLEITRRQASALEEELNRQAAARSQGHKVYIGMRHWHPYIADTVAAMAKDGIRQFTAVCLTPYFSRLSIGAYYEKLDEAVAQAGVPFEITRIESWNDHPLYIAALVEKLQKTLAALDDTARKDLPILFSAHSLPARILKEGDPYPEELQETIRAVMAKVGPYPWHFAYQSQGRTPEPWLGPEAGEVIRELSGKGHRDLVMAPIGFISDHMETLYDVDILYQGMGREAGMRIHRVESLNDSPSLIRALAAVLTDQK